MVSLEFPCKKCLGRTIWLQVGEGVKLSLYHPLQNAGKKKKKKTHLHAQRQEVFVSSRNLSVFKALTVMLINLFKPKLILYMDLRPIHTIVWS